MFRLLPLLLLLIAHAAPAQTPASFADTTRYPVYRGPDLGLTFGTTSRAGTLRVWAPTAGALTLRLYAAGAGGAPTAAYPMRHAGAGTWTRTLPAGASGFYTVQATIDGRARAEVPDPYVHAVGRGGARGAWLDPATAAPADWTTDPRPALLAPTDVMVGEVSVRDISSGPHSGIRHKGKYLGLAEPNTTGPDGVRTGLAHLQELGVTHVHLLPTNDFASIDESRADAPFNWGYDPLHYTVPEGSFATDPTDPAGRIREFRQMVRALHQHGLRVVLDVVYNHTTAVDRTSFEQLVPGYYYRHNPDGSLSDATACGNEVASERPMVRKLIVESLLYWARAYHADGFRFDLMGVLDLETMRAAQAALHALDPTIFLYGEGWTAGPSPLPAAGRALKATMSALPGVGAFSDDLRDALKGPFANHDQPGFVGGYPGLEESVKFGIVGATRHPQVNYAKVNYSHVPWAAEPAQCINYVASHDDLVLWDQLARANPAADAAERTAMDVLANTIVFTSQGVPFLPIGDEFLRTKQGATNSYNLPDSINQLHWDRKARYLAVFDFYRRLLALRRAHPAFRLPTQALIAQHLRFLPNLPAGTVGYQLRDHAGGDAWRTITVLFNGNRAPAALPLPAGTYTVVLRGQQLREQGLETLRLASDVTLAGSTALVLVE